MQPDEQITVLHNGVIRTMEPAATLTPPPTAIAIRGAQIAAFGPDDRIKAFAGRSARHIDLSGATVMPGLIDTHPHLMHFGITYATHVDISDAKSHEEIVERIRARAAVTPAGEWILTTPVGEPHYFIRRSWHHLAEGRLPSREVLDRATMEHPVMIEAWAPVIPNVCALNTPALQRIGIDRNSPDRVSNVWIEKDHSGEPTGILRGSVTNYYTGDPWWNEILKQVPGPRLGDMLRGTRDAMRAYNAMGVTTVYEGHVMTGNLIGAYRMLRGENALTVRVLAALEAECYAVASDRALSIEEYLANLELALKIRDVGDNMMRVEGVTASRGGPCWPGFILMRDPYRGPYGEMTTGHEFVSREKADLAVEFCARNGLRLNCVVAGTGEHDEWLARLEAADRQYGIHGRHWILQHVFFLEAEQARRYGALGIDVTTSMSFCWGKGDLFIERIGEHVLPDLIPLRRMLDAGMIVACGSDWGPKNIFEHIQLAMTHRFAGSGRSNLELAQRIERDEAIAMWTRGAARVLQWERIGTLAPGNHADLVVVDRDPMTCDLDELPETHVIMTMLDGEQVYDSAT